MTSDKYAFFQKEFFSKKNAFPNYISNIYFGKNIKCEHWYYKVIIGGALKDHTEAVHKGIRNKCDTCAFVRYRTPSHSITMIHIYVNK